MKTFNQYSKAAEIIPNSNIHIQEFIALLSGIRQAIRTTSSQKDLETIKNNFPELKICYRKKFFWNEADACLISKTQKVLNKMIDIIFNKDCRHFDQALEGKLLGFPDCCIKKHMEYVNSSIPIDYDLAIYNAFKSSDKCSYYINNIFSFSTRVRILVDNKKREQYESLNEENNLQIYKYFYISHIPCRHDCEASIKIGKRIDNLLKKYCPADEIKIKELLSKPVLYFSTFRIIIFDGYVSEGVLYYSKILPPYFPIDSILLNNINKGNKIIYNNKEVIIMKNRTILFTYQKTREADGFVIDFSG